MVTTQVMNNQQQYNAATTLYDGLLRVRQTQQPTPQGGRLVTDTFYDSRGWVAKKNTNWWDSTTTPGATLVTVPDSQVDNQDATAFDGAGQPVLDTSYDRSAIRSQTATAYTGDKVIAVPLNATGRPFAGGAATATVTDALGRTVAKDDYTTLPTVTVTAGAITTVAITGGSTQATQYVYNTVGRQTDVKDATTGEDWNAGYNLLGQTVTKTDPDAGTSTMTYDPAGNVVQTTDSRNKTISFTYDALNRKTGEFDAPVSGQTPGNQLVGWAYDNANNAVVGMSDPVGKLTTATSYAGGNAYVDQQSGFNANGESLGDTITIPAAEGALAGAYSFTHTYTSGTALPDHDSYPASPGDGTLPAETVTHAYETSLDLPVGPGGLASYTDNADYTPDQHVAELELGLNQGNHADLTNTYDAHTRSLTDTQVTNAAVSATPLDDTSYSYDPAGNPTDQADKRLTNGTVTAETQCFGYDNLDRLTQAWTATDSCAADPTTNNAATIGDGITGSAYWTNWTFDPLGQPTKQVNHGLSGAADTVTTYTYGTTQPNTLAATTTTGPAGTSATSYGADSAGNTTTRDTPANGAQTLTWSDTGQLTAVATTPGASSYIYGANGTLLLQKDPGRTTLYLPQEQLQLDTATGAITGNRYYALPGGGQAVRSGAGANYSFEIANTQGTGLLVLDNTLTAPTWRQFTPYGAPRGTAPVAWPDNKGFLNDPNDTATGLTDIGARWYDPSTGRFVSLDPLFEADSSQEQNGYTYSGDNPIAKSDPTGLRPADCYGACETSYLSGLHSNGGYRGMGENGYSGGYSSGCWGCTYGRGPSHITWFNNFWGNQIPKPTLWLGICPWGQCQASPPPPLPKPRTCGLLDITGKCAPLSPARPGQSHRSFLGSLWHDTVGKLRLPDYYTANFGFVFGIPDTDFGFGVSFNVTMTRGGKFYDSGGLVEGSPGVGASARAGWLDTFKRPSEKQIDHYIDGPAWALEVTGGNGGPGPSYATVWGSPDSFGPGAFSSELGLGTGSGESWNLSQSDAWRNGGW